MCACLCVCVCVSCCEAAVRGGRVEIRVRWLLLLQEQQHIAGTHLPTMFVLYITTRMARYVIYNITRNTIIIIAQCALYTMPTAGALQLALADPRPPTPPP